MYVGIILLICSLVVFTIGAGMIISDEDYVVVGLLNIISGIVVFIFGMLSLNSTGMVYLWEHVDDDKTRITKVNGNVSEMYITIDDKEYHFEFPLKEEVK